MRSAGVNEEQDGSLPPEVRPGRTADSHAGPRWTMVEEQLRARDIDDPRVLHAMATTPRHLFVPETAQAAAYEDRPLPIGHGQTISQPYIVALMTQLAAPQPEDRVLDVGTGSGYQAAVLAALSREVYSIEIVAPLAEQASRRLAQLGYSHVKVRQGDGYQGWPEQAPFQAILLAAWASRIPQPLVDQLAPGGRLVMPLGGYPQHLILLRKDLEGKIQREIIAPVAFVPMTGRAQEER